MIAKYDAGEIEFAALRVFGQFMCYDTLSDDAARPPASPERVTPTGFRVARSRVR
jgi:hypothetical protein